ncbi:MAG: hypothetical protein M3552_08695 [Planctomycetota bacterium]|nr:hypothetical protein [Planctomycetaceae bacterium]MDQ3330719.1 hypothetical protein [Planctomycetota bacterium]
MVAVPGGRSAILFDRESGAVLENRLLLSSTDLGDAKVDDLIFAPDGRSLIFLCNKQADGRYLRQVALRLDASEIAIVSRGRTAKPATQPKPVPAVAAAEFEAPKSSTEQVNLSAKEIAKRHLAAVVGVES